MKKIVYIILFLMLPLCVSADEKSKSILDKAVATIESSLPMTMSFCYEMFDDEGNLQVFDEGSLTIAENKKYNVSLSFMKIWCNGVQQWNYMSQTNEIYITSADSEDVLMYSPLHIMKLYKNGYDCTLTQEGDDNIVTMKAIGAAEIDALKLIISNSTMQMKTVEFYTPQGKINIKIKKYDKKCKVSDEDFICNTNEYPDAEIINMMN